MDVAALEGDARGRGSRRAASAGRGRPPAGTCSSSHRAPGDAGWPRAPRRARARAAPRPLRSVMSSRNPCQKGGALDAHQLRLVLDPDDPPVLRDHPVLHAELVDAARLFSTSADEHPLAVIGMDRSGPQRGVVDHFLGRVAEQHVLARRDVGRAGKRRESPGRTPACRSPPGSSRRSCGTSPRLPGVAARLRAAPRCRA